MLDRYDVWIVKGLDYDREGIERLHGPQIYAGFAMKIAVSAMCLLRDKENSLWSACEIRHLPRCGPEGEERMALRWT